MVSTLLVCLTVLLVVARSERFIDRWLALFERAAERAAAPEPRQEAVSIPSDLYAIAQSYEDLWAREQAELVMREMYGELGSWDLVRVNYGPGGPKGGDDR